MQKLERIIDNSIVKVFISEKVVLSVIIINSLSLFLDAFPSIHKVIPGVLFGIDYICAIYFIIEVTLKFIIFKPGNYWKNKWNLFDFIIVLISLPSLLSPFMNVRIFSTILILRLARLFRFFRLLKFIPNGPKIWDGASRAIKASIGIAGALFLINIIHAVGATSLFNVFTVEGWYDIPDTIAKQNQAGMWTLIIRIYFIASVLIGGILGLSLVNAIFVDEMTADNTDEVEDMVTNLRKELQVHTDKIQMDRKEFENYVKNELKHFREILESIKNQK